MQQNMNDIGHQIYTGSAILPGNYTNTAPLTEEQTRDIADHLGPHATEDHPENMRGSADVADYFLTHNIQEPAPAKKQVETENKEWELPEFKTTSQKTEKQDLNRPFSRLFGMFAQNNKPATMEEYHQQGIAFSEKKNLKMAIKMLEQAIKMGATDLDCHLHLGLAYGRTGRLQDAISLLSDARTSHTTDPGVATLLGKTLLLNGQYQEATEVMASASAKNKNRFNLHFFLGIAHAKLNEFDLAIDAWMTASKLRPSHQMTRDFLNRALDAKMDNNG